MTVFCQERPKQTRRGAPAGAPGVLLISGFISVRTSFFADHFDHFTRGVAPQKSGARGAATPSRPYRLSVGISCAEINLSK